MGLEGGEKNACAKPFCRSAPCARPLSPQPFLSVTLRRLDKREARRTPEGASAASRPVTFAFGLAVRPGCRLRGGRFDRLPALESLFFCWPKRKVTQRKWP